MHFFPAAALVPCALPVGPRGCVQAVEKIRNTTRTDWYNLRTLQYPFPAAIVETLMRFLSLILGVQNSWPNLLLYFSNSDANIKAGVREALIRPYDVRLVDLVCEGNGFDVMQLASSPSRLGAAAAYLALPDIHENNIVFKCVPLPRRRCLVVCVCEGCVALRASSRCFCVASPPRNPPPPHRRDAWTGSCPARWAPLLPGAAPRTPSRRTPRP